MPPFPFFIHVFILLFLFHAFPQKRNAIALLQQAQAQWSLLVSITSAHLLPEIPLHDNAERNFSWAALEAQVAYDIAIAERM
jgi:hypothetical protein